MPPPRPRRPSSAPQPSLLLDLPDSLIVHVVLRLATNADDPHSRRDAFSALALMRCCRRLLAIIEASDEVWEAMVAAELFSPTTVGAPHPARERLRRLRQLSLTGFWAVSGQYATGETYSYEMQLCDFSNTRIWPHLVEDGHAQPILLPQFQVDDEHTVPVLKAHFARAGLPEAPLCDGQRSNWLVGDVAGPWPMRIVAKAVRNMIVFNEVCSDDSSHGRWVNLCSAVVSEDGKRMEGVWMQTRNGKVIVSAGNSGTFKAVRTEVPPDGADHVAWYLEQRSDRWRRWVGRTEGGLSHDMLEAWPEGEPDDDSELPMLVPASP